MKYDFKFTKQPWDVRFTSIYANRRIRIFQTAFSGIVGEDDKREFDVERVANANLIAVAPDNIYRLVESTKLLESILEGRISIPDIVKQIKTNKYGIEEAVNGKKRH